MTTYKTYFFIGLSLLIAMILSILPLPSWAAWFRPQWLILVSIFWIISLPHQLGLITMWLIGLLNDALQGTLLGEHSLAMVLVTYLAIKFSHKIQLFPRVQQLFYIAMFVVIYQLTLVVIETILTGSKLQWQYGLSTISSLLLWPWIEIILKSYQRRFNIN